MHRLFLKIIFISSILINSSFAEIIKEIKILVMKELHQIQLKFLPL